MSKKTKNENDVVAVMNKIQAQLAVLDQKLDSFMTKSLTELAQAKAASKPFVPQHQPPRVQVQQNQTPRPQIQQNSRPMFQAICADCQKGCELPFKPSADRPVYCKECFAKRKAGNGSRMTIAPKPQATAFVPAVNNPAVHVSQPLVEKKKKPVVAKKSAVKKTAPKKKKK